MDAREEACQYETLSQMGRPLNLLERSVRLVQGKLMGLERRLRRLASLAGELSDRLVPAPAVPGRPRGEPPPAPAYDLPESLGLEAGDWVRVRSLEEIRSTLDARGFHKGLSFMPGMDALAGRRLRVLKPVRQIYDEHHRDMRRLKNTVILEGATCGGTGVIEGCDRACPFFWREIWLERAEAPATVDEAPAAEAVKTPGNGAAAPERLVTIGRGRRGSDPAAPAS